MSAPDRAPGPQGWPLFRTAAGTDPRYAEFADARTLVTLNSRLVGRDVADARPGDLLYFRRPGAAQPDHVMVVVGPLGLRSRRRLGRLSHRPRRRVAGRGAQGAARPCCNAIPLRPGGRWPPTPRSSACSGWRCCDTRSGAGRRGCGAAPRRCAITDAAAQPDAPAPVGPAFSLSTSQAVTTSERAEIWLTFRQLPSLDFRVYKVRDPMAFLAGLRHPHQFGTGEAAPVPQQPTLIERIASWKAAQRRQVRNFLRAQTTPAVPPGAPRRRRLHAGVAAGHAAGEHLRAGAAAQPRSAGHLLARAAAPPARSRDAAPAARPARAPASTSWKRCTNGGAPTRWSSSRTSASWPRHRRARCCSSRRIATAANRAPACEARVLSRRRHRGHRTHLGRRRPGRSPCPKGGRSPRVQRDAGRRVGQPARRGAVRRPRRHRRPGRMGVPAAGPRAGRVHLHRQADLPARPHRAREERCCAGGSTTRWPPSIAPTSRLPSPTRPIR